MIKDLHVLVEGPDDLTFIEGLGKNNQINNRYNIKPIPYSGKTKGEIKKKLKAFEMLSNRGISDYIFFADNDEYNTILEKINKIKEKYGEDIIKKEKVVIVKEEIESWYLAGLNDTILNNLKIRFSNQDTNCVTKEIFNKCISKACNTEDPECRTSFLVEIIKKFEVDIARTKNNSFAYLYENFDLLHTDN